MSSNSLPVNCPSCGSRTVIREHILLPGIADPERWICDTCHQVIPKAAREALEAKIALEAQQTLNGSDETRTPLTDPGRSEGQPGEPGESNAKGLWGSDPVLAFERLRDRVCEALHLVVEVHRRARAAAPGQSMADVGQELLHALGEAIVEAQSIWFATPIARYLDRSEGPVNLDHLDHRAVVGRVSGSCHHELVLAVSVGLLRWIEEALPASEYVAAMRFYTAAGNHVAEHLTELVAQVRCECQQGIARWEQRASRSMKLDELANLQSEKVLSGSGLEGSENEAAESGNESTSLSRDELMRQLTRVRRLAYLAYAYAETKAGKRLQDHEAYDLLKEEGIEDKAGELTDYQLPATFDTWSRYLREARSLLDDRKYNRRQGRPVGKSIVKSNQIEQQKPGGK